MGISLLRSTACAQWIPEAAFLDPRSMEPIGSVSEHGETGGIDGIPRWRYELNCTHCSSDPAVKYAGACVKCTFPGCTYAVHPMCTRMAEGGKNGEAPHLCLTMDDTGAVVNGFTVAMHCPDHMSEAMRDSVIGSATLRGRYVEAAKEALTERLEQARQAAEERQRALEARKAAGVWKKAKEDDNSTYTGGWIKDLRHGRGTLRLSTGFVFDGLWMDGQMEGRGICTYPDGSRFEGMWKGGRKEGRGTLVFPNSAVYVEEEREEEEREDEGRGNFAVCCVLCAVCCVLCDVCCVLCASCTMRMLTPLLLSFFLSGTRVDSATTRWTGRGRSRCHLSRS